MLIFNKVDELQEKKIKIKTKCILCNVFISILFTVNYESYVNYGFKWNIFNLLIIIVTLLSKSEWECEIKFTANYNIFLRNIYEYLHYIKFNEQLIKNSTFKINFVQIKLDMHL